MSVQPVVLIVLTETVYRRKGEREWKRVQESMRKSNIDEIENKRE